MYSSLLYSVKTEHGLSPSFETKIGVKQGCILGPTLFSLYLNDLNDCFDISCDPVVIDTTKISSYADDIVLLSNTAEGLQNALNTLGHFCKTWNLKINISKTKVIVFINLASSLKDLALPICKWLLKLFRNTRI